MALLKWLSITVAACYVAFVVILYLAQRSLLYPVPQTTRTPPKDVGFAEAEEHVLRTSDGEDVIAWHVAPRDGKPVVVFLHGNGDILAWRVPRFRALTSDGTGLVAVSFRGYAGSSGHPTEAALLDDADAAYAFAAQRYPPERIVVWGFSLGTGPAVAVAAKQRIGKLILEAPYTSTTDVAAPLFPFIPVRWLMSDQFHSDRRIANVTAPLLLMHGQQDQVIPIRLGERLFDLAHGPKQMVRFSQGGHDNLDDFGAIDVVRDFLSRSTT
jgi:fermentation-respiration switch protein FrsA (DUF1100 family)